MPVLGIYVKKGLLFPRRCDDTPLPFSFVRTYNTMMFFSLNHFSDASGHRSSLNRLERVAPKLISFGMGLA
jgi:hypothetical protein